MKANPARKMKESNADTSAAANDRWSALSRTTGVIALVAVVVLFRADHRDLDRGRATV